MTTSNAITVEIRVASPLQKVWDSFTGPEHITKWNTASPDWHTPRAENDLRVGGKFLSRMEARDGTVEFDLVGFYDEVIPLEKITYHLEDGRKVWVTFAQEGDVVKVVETFEPENENPPEFQKGGWQAILDSFKTYTEAL